MIFFFFFVSELNTDYCRIEVCWIIRYYFRNVSVKNRQQWCRNAWLYNTQYFIHLLYIINFFFLCLNFEPVKQWRQAITIYYYTKYVFIFFPLLLAWVPIQPLPPSCLSKSVIYRGTRDGHTELRYYYYYVYIVICTYTTFFIYSFTPSLSLSLSLFLSRFNKYIAPTKSLIYKPRDKSKSRLRRVGLR